MEKAAVRGREKEERRLAGVAFAFGHLWSCVSNAIIVRLCPTSSCVYRRSDVARAAATRPSSLSFSLHRILFFSVFIAASVTSNHASTRS